MLFVNFDHVTYFDIEIQRSSFKWKSSLSLDPHADTGAL